MSEAVTPIVEGMLGEYVKGALATFFDARKRKNDADDKATPKSKKRKSARDSEASITLGEDALALLQDATVDFVEAKNKENKSLKPSPLGEKLSAKKTKKRRSSESVSTSDANTTQLREEQSTPVDSAKKAKRHKSNDGVASKVVKSSSKKRTSSKTPAGQSSTQNDTTEVEQKPTTPTKVEVDNATATKQSPKDEDAKSDRTIFVGNLPVNYDKRKLRKLFAECGKVESTRIRGIIPGKAHMPRKVAAARKAFSDATQCHQGYVVFESSDAVKNALLKNGIEVNGHRLRVDGVGQYRQQLVPERTVVVGNIDKKVGENAVREHFSSCGAIEVISMPRQRGEAEHGGLAFIQFEDAGARSLAFKIDGSQLGRREVRVTPYNKQHSKEKKPNVSKANDKTKARLSKQIGAGIKKKTKKKAKGSKTLMK